MTTAALKQAIRPTTLIEAPGLASELGLSRLVIASEAGQHTGSFKFRAAYHLASTVPQQLILTASSGNFGQAVAYACQLLGKQCIIVMPDNSAKVKVDAVRRYGGRVEMVNTKVKSRAERVQELAAEHPDAYVASAYDDTLVIAGNASLGEELAAIAGLDVVVAPVGGGGLSAGVVTGLRAAGSTVSVIGAEPLLANDAARSLREGRIVVNETEPQTIADGARTVSLGRHNWNVLQTGLAGIVEVPEDRIKESLRRLKSELDLRVEPTGAVALGAVMTAPERFAGQAVCVVVSGGNVDEDLYQSLLNG